MNIKLILFAVSVAVIVFVSGYLLGVNQAKVVTMPVEVRMEPIKHYSLEFPPLTKVEWRSFVRVERKRRWRYIVEEGNGLEVRSYPQ